MTLRRSIDAFTEVVRARRQRGKKRAEENWIQETGSLTGGALIHWTSAKEGKSNVERGRTIGAVVLPYFLPPPSHPPPTACQNFKNISLLTGTAGAKESDFRPGSVPLQIQMRHH